MDPVVIHSEMGLASDRDEDLTRRFGLESKPAFRLLERLEGSDGSRDAYSLSSSQSFLGERLRPNLLPLHALPWKKARCILPVR
jgi:hypothetical protein